jgi:hypothetical protein
MTSIKIPANFCCTIPTYDSGNMLAEIEAISLKGSPKKEKKNPYG